MRLRARAAWLCAATAASAIALIPAAAQAQEPAAAPTMHFTIWPGTVASGADAVGTPEAMVPEIVSAGACEPGDGTKTFTFSYADQGVILGADGRFEEHGSFTIARLGGGLRVVDLDSTFSGASANGTIEGERHMREDEAPRTGVGCRGTSADDRQLEISVQRAHTVHRLTSAATGAVTTERGFANFSLASWHGTPSIGWYVALFQAEQDADADGDEVVDAVDNCPLVANTSQRDSDGDRLGDACDDAFDSTEGFAGGGGRLAGGVHLSIALHSGRGRLHGSGHLTDGVSEVRLVDVRGLWSDGGRAVAVGTARVGDGAPEPYRVELTDGTDAFELEVGDRRWAGTLTQGNLVVK